MAMMNAALVTSFYEPPHLQRIPAPKGPVVEVVAVAVHPRVRAVAAGSECERLGDPPLVPGIDGVGRRADGTLVYFLAASELFGTMAELAIADPARSVELPAGTDPVLIAAGVHPAVSVRLGLDASGDGADVRDATYWREVPYVVGSISSVARVRTIRLDKIESGWLLPEPAGTRTVIVP